MIGNARDAASGPLAPNLEAERFRALLMQLADRFGGAEKHGVKTAVGKLLGLEQAHVSQLMHPTEPKWASWPTITRVAKRIEPPLRLEFFTDEKLVNPHYTHFQGNEQPPPAVPVVETRPAAASPLRAIEAVANVEPPARPREITELIAFLRDKPEDLTPREIELVFLALRHGKVQLALTQPSDLDRESARANADAKRELDDSGGQKIDSSTPPPAPRSRKKRAT